MIRRELGRGSFGVVYLAYDPRLRREVALKVPRGEVLLSGELRARFRNEAMAAAGLDHPNIVAVYEAGEEGPCCFIASAQANLAMLLEKTGRIDEAERSARRAAVLRVSLTKDFPNTPWHFLRLAEAHRGLARLQIQRGDFAEARRLREQSVAATRAALAIAPENTEFRRLLASECASLVETLISLRKHDEATRCAAEFASLVHDSAKEILRAGSFMSQCVPLATADLELTGSRRAELAEAYAKRAIELAGEAARKGYRDVDALRKDKGFDSLRGRTDFSALLAGMVTAPGAR